MIYINKKDECFLQLDLEDKGQGAEIAEHFKFLIPNYRFNPKVKRGLWDGYFRLFNNRARTIYVGLLEQLKQFLETLGYEYQVTFDESQENFSLVEAEEFIKTLGIPEKYEIRDYQVKAFVRAVRCKRLLLLSATNCHRAGDHVYMSDGSIKNVEDIIVGDRVIGYDGLPKEITRLYRGRDKIYEIKPHVRSPSIFVSGNHVLPVEFSCKRKRDLYNSDGKLYNITVNDFLKMSNWERLNAKLHYNVIEMKLEIYHQPILDPYFIGLYIGDGHTHCCNLTTADKEIVEYLQNYIPSFDDNMYVKKKNKIPYVYSIIDKRKNYNRINREMLQYDYIIGCNEKRTKCGDKFIPEKLFSMSVENRYRLLAGLVDSDGYCDNKTAYQFSSKSKRLINDIERLAISLGIIASNKKAVLNKKYNRYYHYISLLGKNLKKIPVLLERKKINLNSDRFDSPRWGFSVIEHGVEDIYGFEVEDSLYVTNGGMITHNSGKTLLQYYIHRYLENKGFKTLIIVPTTTLVYQTISDFIEYGYDDNKCLGIMAGVDKDLNENLNLVVSTWQSLVDLPSEWFDHFDVVMGDECHLYKAASLKTIMEKTTKAEYRIGLTGTIDDTEIDKMVLTGLFGEIYRVITTRELIDQDKAVDVKIKIIVLKHKKDDVNKKLLDYPKETAYIIKNEKRNRFIKNLTLSLKGNTLILYNFVEDHGKVLYELIKEQHENTFFVSGSVKTQERVEIKGYIGEMNDAVILASYQTFSTGINAPNIRNIIYAQGYKGKIRNLQSIGRGIRKTEGKDHVALYDIADIFEHKKQTYSYKHLLQRAKHYAAEKFKFKIYEVNL